MRRNALSNVMGNDEYAIESAFAFSNGNVEQSGRVLYLSIYMLMYLKPSEMPDEVFRFEAM